MQSVFVGWYTVFAFVHVSVCLVSEQGVSDKLCFFIFLVLYDLYILVWIQHLGSTFKMPKMSYNELECKKMHFLTYSRRVKLACTSLQSD